MNFPRIAGILLLFIALLFLVFSENAKKNGEKRLEFVDLIMTSYIRIILYPLDDNDKSLIFPVDNEGDAPAYLVENNEKFLEYWAEKTVEVAREYEKKLSSHQEGSVIYALNKNRHIHNLETDLLELFRLSLDIQEKSKGYFNIMLGKLIDLWAKCENIPEECEVKAVLEEGKNSRLRIEGNSIFIDGGGNVDLGGIAKGWILDRLRDFLKEQGFRSFLLDIGGDISVYGAKRPDNKPWNISLKHPRGKEPRDFSLNFGSVATSGDYERVRLIDGQFFHHILDPKTGYPSDGCISATVLAGDLATADAWATALVAGFDGENGKLPENIGILTFDKDEKISLFGDYKAYADF